MLLTRLYLRNFRVYEDELDLELPPGLVGIYGPNGSGKSTLLEAITFALWGKARTGRDEIRSAGVAAECITEVQFEHEGHLYVVRRSLAGINATVKAEAHCDGLMMAEGARDTSRYVLSVLGMGDEAFRASVFAEQKQLAAFSSKDPADRRKLVLQLLGITPLDTARDAARKDARDSEARLKELRVVLPDLDALALAADDAAAAAGAAVAVAGDERAAAGTARARADAAGEEFRRLDTLRQEYDALVADGTRARADLDRESRAVADFRAELNELDGLGRDLVDAQGAAAGLPEARAHLDALRAVAGAHRWLATLPDVAEAAPPDEQAAAGAAEAASEAAAVLRAVQARLGEAGEAVKRATEQVQRSRSLSGEGVCPVCGQTLGDAFAQVQAHRAEELAEAERRVAGLQREEKAAFTTARRRKAESEEAEKQLRQARAAHEAWQQASQRKQDALASLAEAEDGLRAALAASPLATGGPEDVPTAAASADSAVSELVAAVTAKEEAASTALRLQTRIEQRPRVEARLAQAEEAAAAAEAAVLALRDKVRQLGFDPKALDDSAESLSKADEEARRAEAQAHQAELAAAVAQQAADDAKVRLDDGRKQHAKLAELETTTRHLSRLKDLLSEFRNTVVASVGPRLATQAAELFGELTDHEYDQLLVDPETYELQISDEGREYGLDRFSGSEIDLANLALRVAISEHVRFQSGGAVGLLVLDEVFGPLDEDRKARMLQALQQLLGRFRQILVVTHDASLKDQLPGAIEVVKRPGRRATARLLVG